MRKEDSLQIAVSTYLKHQYPHVLFTSESSGVRLTIGQAKRLKSMRSNDAKFPDIMIFEPRGGYHGLFIELKKQGEKVFQKNGEPYAGHVADQYKTLQQLKAKGYWAQFCIGFDEAKKTIDTYLTLQPREQSTPPPDLSQCSVPASPSVQLASTPLFPD